MFMFDAATEPVAAVQPDPNRAVPHHVGQVLGVVRTLIAYGRNLADTLRQHAADPQILPCSAFVASIFGTSDFALILTRITRGLLRATALEARLSKRAARGRDLKPMAIRLPSERKSGAAKPATPPGGPAEDACLDRLPTPEEIIAKDRRRPIGAVLVDICLDLGIVPGQMDPATSNELRLAVMLYGGNLAHLLSRREGRSRSGDPAATPSPCGRGQGEGAAPHSPRLSPIPIAGQPIMTFPAWPPPSAQSPAPACAGPP